MRLVLILYASSRNVFAQFNPGDFIDVIAPAAILDNPNGLAFEPDLPRGLTFGSDGNLYVSSQGTNAVLRYDGSTGAFIDAIGSESNEELNGPNDLLFGPDGHLYVSSAYSNRVLR